MIPGTRYLLGGICARFQNTKSLLRVRRPFLGHLFCITRTVVPCVHDSAQLGQIG